ncbi:MAG TPA: HemK/PrmC family methyltransferase [Acidimicrobiia bacterium]|nr:HemK/PrmC family methyltransferase [Acidimicrobiia bacterium]
MSPSGPHGAARELAGALAETLGTREARWVLEDLGAPPGGPLTAEQERAALALAARRGAGEPLQYVLGHWPFRQLDLLVDRRALIPRPETEWVTDVALAELDRLVALGAPPRVVDLGTGTGAIALSIATERVAYDVEVTATDVDPGALELARANHERVGSPSSVRWRAGSWWEALDSSARGRVSLVVANPPYVAPLEWEVLDPVVRDHEPRGALVAGAGSDGTPGFAAVEAVLAGAPEWLGRPGTVVVEIAPSQEGAAVWAAGRSGSAESRVLADLAGRPRALVARWE